MGPIKVTENNPDDTVLEQSTPNLEQPLELNPFKLPASPQGESVPQQPHEGAMQVRKVFAFGDSNTDWSRDRSRRDIDSFDDPPPSNPVGWVEQLNSQTDSLGSDRFGVINRGFAGATVSSLQSEVASFTRKEKDDLSQADYVVVAIGINDAKATSTNPQQFKENYQNLINTLRQDLSEDKPILLVVPSVLNNQHQELNPLLDKYQKAIEELSQENKNIVVVNPRNNPDSHHPTFNNTTLTDYYTSEQNDGIHPSPAGHKLIMEHVVESIEGLEKK